MRLLCVVKLGGSSASMPAVTLLFLISDAVASVFRHITVRQRDTYLCLFHPGLCPSYPRVRRFLSDGNDYRDCGHPCEQHSVQLRDSSGADHLVLADM
jgi:hypothetical protein